MSTALKNTVVSAGLLFGTLGCGQGEKPRNDAAALNDGARIEHSSQKTLRHEALKKFQDNGFEFLKSDGSLFSLEEVQKFVGKNNSTLSFLVSQCGDNVCPNISANFEQMTRLDPSLKNIVVSCSPYQDYQGGMLRNFLDRYHLTEKNTCILFPIAPQTEKKEDLQTRLLHGSEMVRTIQNKLGLIVFGDDLSAHNPSVLLFNKQGQQVQKVNSKEESVTDAFKDAQSQSAGSER